MLCNQQIIEAIKTRLIGNTSALANVVSDRLFPLTKETLPAIRIYELHDEIEQMTVHWPQLEQHDTAVGLEVCAQSVSGIDEALSALRLEVLGELFDTLPHATLGFVNVELAYRGCGPMQPIESADTQIAQRTLQLSARFSAFANAPETFV